MWQFKTTSGYQAKVFISVALMLYILFDYYSGVGVIKASPMDQDNLTVTVPDDSLVKAWVAEYERMWKDKDLKKIFKFYEDSPLIITGSIIGNSGSASGNQKVLFYKKMNKSNFIQDVQRLAAKGSSEMNIDKVEVHKHPKHESIFAINIDHRIETDKKTDNDGSDKSFSKVIYKAYSLIIVDLTYPTKPDIIYSNVTNDPNEIILFEELCID